MSDQKKACLIYVKATEKEVDAVNARLKDDGYLVCKAIAELQNALAAKTGEGNLPAAILECIGNADLCVFLIPEDASDDGAIGSSAGISCQLGKRVVGLIVGARTVFPHEFETASCMIRQNSERIDQAIRGEDVWENPDKSIISDRTIKHVRCQ